MSLFEMKAISCRRLVLSCLAMLLLSFTYAFKSPRHVTFPLHKQHTASKLYSTVTDGTACTNPPRTFIESVRLAGAAVRRALVDGETLLEVEFPPLPLEYLEDSASSARDIANANTQWAVEMGKLLADFGQISLIFPDQPELDDALQYVGGETPSNPFTNVTLSTLRSDSIKNSKSIDQIIGSIFGATVGGTVAAVPGTAIYIALVSSTQELTDLEKLHLLDPSIPIIFFNLRLDFLKGDLGLPFFPGRDFHYRFLSRIRPAFLMRSRSFATSLTKPPFIINYSGLLFRTYPEPFQSILNVGGGKTKVVSLTETRPNTADFRQYLTAALRVPGVNSDELQTKSYELWWEKEDGKDMSRKWQQ